MVTDLRTSFTVESTEDDTKLVELLKNMNKAVALMPEGDKTREGLEAATTTIENRSSSTTSINWQELFTQLLGLLNTAKAYVSTEMDKSKQLIDITTDNGGKEAGVLLPDDPYVKKEKEEEEDDDDDYDHYQEFIDDYKGELENEEREGEDMGNEDRKSLLQRSDKVMPPPPEEEEEEITPPPLPTQEKEIIPSPLPPEGSPLYNTKHDELVAELRSDYMRSQASRESPRLDGEPYIITDNRFKTIMNDTPVTNSNDQSFYNILHWAITNQDVPTVNYLVNVEHADVTKKTNRNETPIDLVKDMLQPFKGALLKILEKTGGGKRNPKKLGNTKRRTSNKKRTRKNKKQNKPKNKSMKRKKTRRSNK